MSNKDIRYSTGRIVKSDGRPPGSALDQEIAELEHRFGMKALTDDKFAQSQELADIHDRYVELKNRRAANKWAGSADSYPSSQRSLYTKDFGRTPQPVADDIQVKAMYDKAVAGESTVIRTKDLGFNDTAEAQLPPQLAPWITQAVHERRLLDRLPTTACTAPSYEIVRHVSTTGAAAVTAEGGLKPEVKLNLDHITLPMVKIAANTAVSWEVISDYDRFLNYVQVELPLRIVEVENDQLLYGTGSGDGELLGFANTPDILTFDAQGATDVAALDAIEESIENLRSGPALAEPDLFVTSPSTWSALRRIKDLYGRYYLSPDPTQEEAMNLWGVPVLVTTQADPGDGFLIDTTKFGKVVVREGITIRQGSPRTISFATC